MERLQIVCPIQAAIDALADRLKRVEAEVLRIDEAAGRILAEDLLADRDSPACDVSAMDGYAFRYRDYEHGRCFSVAGECSAGRPAVELPVDAVVRIFTGAPLPREADTVIEREQAEVVGEQVRFNLLTSQLNKGRSVRKQGENLKKGQVALEAGTFLSPTAVSSLASFGSAQVSVRRRVRVSVLNTGNELVSPGMPLEVWQIRDSNGPLLESILHTMPYVVMNRRKSIRDDLDSMRAAVATALEDSDVIFLTGGVSAGDYDYVPQVLNELKVERVFHKLPQKPGKPIFGGVGPQGQLVCGLPGNPVSVAVTGRRIALPLIQFLAGHQASCLMGSPIQVTVASALNSSQLVLYQMARVNSYGEVVLDSNKGSGDLVSLG